MLHLALEFDRRIYQGITSRSALAELRLLRRFDGPFLNALVNYSPAQAEFEVRRLPVHELRAGMVLEKDVFSKNGHLLILKKETCLTETWIERLENFTKTRGAQGLVDVRVPTLVDVRR